MKEMYGGKMMNEEDGEESVAEDIHRDIERRALLEHGTKAFLLKPSSVLAAAEEDLRRSVRNIERSVGEYEHYAFHRKHVAKAMKDNIVPNGKMLIQIALGNLEIGCASGKHWTRVIYSDPELLKRALSWEG
jgi:hypothetical protein